MINSKIIINWRLIPEQKGKAIHTVLSISRDITRTKLAEEALLESKEQFHSLFDSMKELVVLHEMVFDEHGEAVNGVRGKGLYLQALPDGRIPG